MSEASKKLSTESYKGVRDFYPEDMFIQNYIFDRMRKVVESYGYVEYGASILEPTDLYKAKSGEEIVNEQTYSFKDRADRDVTLRPEMTPTVARMVAARKRELAFPLRWYSIPNLFRYEKPQRGRLREHFQLNVDLFGVQTIAAEIEMIELAYDIMKHFGAKDENFKIHINNRKILDYLFSQVFKVSNDESYVLMKLVDKKNKMDSKTFKNEAMKILHGKSESFIELLSVESIDEFMNILLNELSAEVLGTKETKELIEQLHNLSIKNVIFDPTIARGFDYYTGIVFEIHDTSSANPRSIFGGGRYDDLLTIFGSDKVPAVGFGMGDVTIRDYLETYDLLPRYFPPTDILISIIDTTAREFGFKLAQYLRSNDINVALDTTDRKITAQIQSAVKQVIPYIIILGENEIKSKTFTLKKLTTGNEEIFTSEQTLADFILKSKKE